MPSSLTVAPGAPQWSPCMCSPQHMNTAGPSRGSYTNGLTDTRAKEESLTSWSSFKTGPTQDLLSEAALLTIPIKAAMALPCAGYPHPGPTTAVRIQVLSHLSPPSDHVLLSDRVSVLTLPIPLPAQGSNVLRLYLY